MDPEKGLAALRANRNLRREAAFNLFCSTADITPYEGQWLWDHLSQGEQEGWMTRVLAWQSAYCALSPEERRDIDDKEMHARARRMRKYYGGTYPDDPRTDSPAGPG